MRNFWKYFFLTLAFISGFLGFIIVTLWNRGLSEDLYQSALEESNVYETLTNVIESQFTFYLEERGKEIVDNLIAERIEGDEPREVIFRETAIWVVNTVIDNNAANVVQSLSEELNLDQLIQTSVESSISVTLRWARGETESPQFVEYIPTVQEVEELRERDNASYLLRGVAFRAFGFNQLEECSSTDTEFEALTLISNGEWREVTCISEKVEQALSAQIEEVLPDSLVTDLRETLDDRFDTYKIETLVDGVYDVLLNVSQLREDLQEFKTEIAAVRYFGIGLILISVLFTGIGVFLSKKRTFKTVLSIYTLIGFGLMIWSLLFNSFGTGFVEGRIESSDWTIKSEAISVSEGLLLEQSIEKAITYISSHLHDYTIEIGLMLIILMGLPLLVWVIYDNIGERRRHEMYTDARNSIQKAYSSVKERV